MDFIDSAIEASPWGFAGYGFPPYVGARGNNFVLGLAEYWLTGTRSMLSFEKENPSSTCSIRYEDLVADFGLITKSLWDFLEVDSIDLGPSAVFDAMRQERFDASDHKIWYTDAIHDKSVGRGLRIPITGLPPSLRDELNRTLLELEYQQITDTWGSFNMLEDVRQPQGGLGSTAIANVVGGVSSQGPTDPQGERVFEASTRSRDALIDELTSSGVFDDLEVENPVRIVIVNGSAILYEGVHGGPDHLPTRELGERENTPQPLELPLVILTRDAIVNLIVETIDMGSAVRGRYIRCYPASKVGETHPESSSGYEETMVFRDVLRELQRILSSERFAVSIRRESDSSDIFSTTELAIEWSHSVRPPGDRGRSSRGVSDGPS